MEKHEEEAPMTEETAREPARDSSSTERGDDTDKEHGDQNQEADEESQESFPASDSPAW